MTVGFIIFIVVDVLEICFTRGKLIAFDDTAVHLHGSFIDDAASASVHAVVVFDFRSRIDV